MITMSPNLGQMWASGLFALKWITNREIFDSSHLRTGKSRIKLHFVWMPCNSHRRRQSSILQLEEAYNLVAELQHQWGREAPPFACTIPDCSDCKSTKAFSAHNCDTGRPIRSGDIFYIIRDTVDLLPCRFAFDIQWALSYAYAVSGQ
ncbi:hypothetical protein EDB82DRAFT_517987 [Fusarium venenatum]|nr:hypothetical protein EDB82DRAFT_517987 [Fusarium venenatum]